MTPSAEIMAKSAEKYSTVDSLGRRLSFKILTALDKLRIFKAAGPELATNQPWLAMAMLASSVTAIDDIPIPQPSNENQVEALVARLGDSGIEAIAQVLEPLYELEEQSETTAGNSFGTPS